MILPSAWIKSAHSTTIVTIRFDSLTTSLLARILAIGVMEGLIWQEKAVKQSIIC